MAEYVIMPKLGFNMEKGTVVKWLVREGDLVKEQDEILEIETDKTVMPVEAQTSGILRKILVAEGEEVPVTLPIAIIAGKDEDISKMIDEAYQKLGKTEVVEKEESKVDRKVSPVIEESQEIEAKKEKEEFKKISPGARRKAKELGVEVESVEGSGPGGVVIEKDVISYYQNHQVKVSPVAQKIAEKVGVDLGTIKGTGIGGKKMKRDHQEILTKGEEVNKTEKRLSVLSKEIKKLIRLARERKLMPEDYNGGTFTISNLGMYGVDNFTAIINHPEAAILTVGTAKRVPVVIEEKGAEKIEVRSLIEATLSVDHRLIDGAKAANFLKRLKHYLEFPESLVLC